MSTSASPISIALLGPPGTYSDFALQHYGKEHRRTYQKQYCPSIKAIFASLQRGETEQGIVPFENEIHGLVLETVRELKKHTLQVIDRLRLNIEHALVSLQFYNPEEITVIASHPQALGQCSKYLEQKFPRAKMKPYASTIKALQKMRTTPNQPIAAIIPLMTAEQMPDLKILSTNIQNRRQNRTTFLLIGKIKAP